MQLMDWEECLGVWEFSVTLKTSHEGKHILRESSHCWPLVSGTCPITQGEFLDNGVPHEWVQSKGEGKGQSKEKQESYWVWEQSATKNPMRQGRVAGTEGSEHWGRELQPWARESVFAAEAENPFSPLHWLAYGDVIVSVKIPTHTCRHPLGYKQVIKHIICIF